MTNILSIVGLLHRWVGREAGAPAADWLGRAVADLAAGADDASLDLAFARAPRMVGRGALVLDAADRAAAEVARPGWRPEGWSRDGAARVLMLLHLPPDGFAARFRRLRQAADAAELVALFRGLPLYPDPQGLEGEAGEGLRSNMRPVFEAVAHDSPYPREVFDEHRWNHMVLKALFVDSRLDPIQGLDERANPELAVILRDYARERRAAGRQISPELWRCLIPFAQAVGAEADVASAALERTP